MGLLESWYMSDPQPLFPFHKWQVRRLTRSSYGPPPLMATFPLKSLPKASHMCFSKSIEWSSLKLIKETQYGAELKAMMNLELCRILRWWSQADCPLVPTLPSCFPGGLEEDYVSHPEEACLHKCRLPTSCLQCSCVVWRRIWRH